MLKEKKIKILILIASIVLIMVGTSCTGTRNVDSVNAISLFSKETINLPIIGKNTQLAWLGAMGYTEFLTKLSLEQIYDDIKDNELYNAQMINNSIFLIKQNGDVQDYYCLNNTDEKRFIFGGMRAVVTVDVALDGSKEEMSILLPIHLISDDRIIKSCPSYNLYVNMEYESYSTIEEFYEFYKNCGWYDVKIVDDCIEIYGYSEKAEICNDLANGDKDNLDINKKIIIKFRNIEDKNYFLITTE